MARRNGWGPDIVLLYRFGIYLGYVYTLKSYRQSYTLHTVTFFLAGVR